MKLMQNKTKQIKVFTIILEISGMLLLMNRLNGVLPVTTIFGKVWKEHMDPIQITKGGGRYWLLNRTFSAIVYTYDIAITIIKKEAVWGDSSIPFGAIYTNV